VSEQILNGTSAVSTIGYSALFTLVIRWNIRTEDKSRTDIHY